MAEDFAGSWGCMGTLLKMQVKLLTPRPTFEPGIVLPVAPKVILDQHRLRSRPNSTGKPARNGTRNRLLLIDLTRERVENSATYDPLVQCVLRFPYELFEEGGAPVVLVNAKVRRVSTSATTVYWTVVTTVLLFIVMRCWNARNIH